MVAKLIRRSLTATLNQIPLRVILVFPFILQIATAVGIVSYLSFKQGQAAVTDLATQLQEKASEQVNQHLDSYLAIPEKINQLNLDAIEQGLLDLDDLSSLGRYFWHQVQVFENVNYINYASAQGKFIGAGAWIEGKGVVIDEVSAATGWKAHAYEADASGNRTQLAQVYHVTCNTCV
jgi:hypothetical protein